MDSDQMSGYRKVLHDELRRRMARNKRYSIRGFARDLGMNSTQLVRVLNGTRSLSLRIAKQISGHLFSDKVAQASFISLVELESTKDAAAKNAERIAAMADIHHEVRPVSLRTMSKMKSWSYYAILDLLGLKKGPRDVASIAKYFGLAPSVVREIIDTLIECDLVEREDGVLRKKYAFLAWPEGVSSSYIKEYHRQMMERAKRALERQDLNRRYFYGATIGVTPDMYSELVEATEDYFRRVQEIARLSEKNAEKLYQVNLQIFDHRVD